jgi:homogentisate 1,2-dioxygenase
MEKGSHVRHKKTFREGVVQGFSKKHPGWVKVVWAGDTVAYRYEPNELELVKCGKEHSEFPGYFCVLTKGHDGWCGCA